MKKRFLSALMALCMMMYLMPATALAEGTGGSDTNGICGKPAEGSSEYSDSVTWSFDSTTGTLTISGTGEMAGFKTGDNENRPWAAYTDTITSLVIESGVTSIGTNAFYGLTELTGTITIPDSVLSIGSAAFQNCGKITAVVLSASTTTYGTYIFRNCFSISSVNWDSFTPDTIPDGMFDMVAATTDTQVALGAGSALTLPAHITTIGTAAFSGVSWYFIQ